MRLINAALFAKELEEYYDQLTGDGEIGACIDIQDMLDEQPTVNLYKWISVEDRLPENKVNCIVYYKHAYCDHDGYWAIGVSFYDGNEFRIGLAYKVTHWTPLPAPPTEKEN